MYKQRNLELNTAFDGQPVDASAGVMCKDVAAPVTSRAAWFCNFCKRGSCVFESPLRRELQKSMRDVTKP